MSSLPPLPSSMTSAPLPATTVGADKDLLETAVQIKLHLEGPGFKAREHLSSEEAVLRKDYAMKLLCDDGFNAMWLAQFSRNINLDTEPLETVLQHTRAIDVGEVGDLSVNAVMYMERMGKLPKPPGPKFQKAIEEGRAKVEDMISMAKSLTTAIEKWFRMRDDMLAPFTGVKVQLGAKFDEMVTQIALTQTLATNEDERTMTLVQDTALMEFVILRYPERLQQLKVEKDSSSDPQAVQKKIDRLTQLQPLVLRAITTLNPLIFTGYAAVDRYVQLSNMAGGRAMVLGLFLSACIARWESDVVTEIIELQQIAAGLALAKVEDFMNEQGEHSSAKMIEVSQQYVDLMKRWSVTLQHMETVLNDAQITRQILKDGFKDLVRMHGQTTSAVEDAMEKIVADKLAFNDEMENTAREISA